MRELHVAVEDKRLAAMRQLLVLAGCERMRDLDSDFEDCTPAIFGQGLEWKAQVIGSTEHQQA